MRDPLTAGTVGFVGLSTLLTTSIVEKYFVGEIMTSTGTHAALMNLPDHERVQNLMDMLCRRRYEVDADASKLLLQYTNELGQVIMEQAALLTSHRKDTVISVADVQLILAKKHGIHVPGSAPIRQLHREAIRGQAPDAGMTIAEHQEKNDKKRRDAIDSNTEKGRSRGGRKKRG
jgi:histone H3/H4